MKIFSLPVGAPPGRSREADKNQMIERVSLGGFRRLKGTVSSEKDYKKVCIQSFCPLLVSDKMEEVKHFAHRF